MSDPGKPPDPSRGYPLQPTQAYDPLTNPDDEPSNIDTLEPSGYTRSIDMGEASVNNVGPGRGGTDTNKAKVPNPKPWRQ